MRGKMMAYYTLLLLTLMVGFDQISSQCPSHNAANLTSNKMAPTNKIVTLTCQHAENFTLYPTWIISDHYFEVTQLPIGFSAVGQSLQFNCTYTVIVRCLFTPMTGGDSICSDFKELDCAGGTPNTPLHHASDLEDCIIETTFLLRGNTARIELYTTFNASATCMLKYTFSAAEVDSLTDSVEFNQSTVVISKNGIERFYDNDVRFEIDNTCATTCSSVKYYLPHMSPTEHVTIDRNNQTIIQDLSTYRGELERCANPQATFCYYRERTACIAQDDVEYCKVFKIPMCDCDSNSMSLVGDGVTSTVLSIFTIGDDNIRHAAVLVVNIEISVDECADNDCEHNCTNTNAPYYCKCNEGYVIRDDGKTCQDIDECMMSLDDCEHNCTNTNGSYYCNCNEGYVIRDDGKTCQDIDECNMSLDDCEHNCTNTNGSYYCNCSKGYVIRDDGKTCQVIDECMMSMGGCEQKCNNTPGSYECYCTKGTLQPDNFTCRGEEDRTKFIALGVLAGLVVLGCVVQGVVAGVIKVCLLCKNKQREHKIDHNGSSRDHSSTITLKKVKSR